MLEASGSLRPSGRSDRLLRILTVVSGVGSASIAELARGLGASTATIRRDVATLAARGLVERTRGGCRATARTGLPVQLREGVDRDKKRAIAREAARHVPTGACAVALSGGSTVAEVFRCLAGRADLTVVTNSMVIANEAVTSGRPRVLLAGGVLERSALELVGSMTDAALRPLHVRLAVVGCDGVSATGGVTMRDDAAARTTATMVARADRVMVVADGSKLGVTAFAQVAGAGRIDVLVTDASADPGEVIRLSRRGVRVLVVSEDDPGPD